MKINREWVWGYIFVLPALIGLLVFMAYPLASGFRLSLYEVGLMKNVWVGLENYRKLAQDKDFFLSLLHSAQYTLGILVFGVTSSLLLAILLNSKLKLERFFRTVYYLPVVTSLVAVSMVWKGLLSGQGLINQIISLFGVEQINWLTDPRYAMWAIVLMSVWKGVGFNMVLFIGGLNNISKSTYEAADIDGATGIKRFFHITLPLLSPTIFFVMITTIIQSFQVFEQAQILTKGGPKGATTTIVLEIYQNAFANFQAGYASAQAFILFLILLVLTSVQFLLQRKWVHYD